MRKDTLILRVSLCALTCVLSLACITARSGTKHSPVDYAKACDLLTQLEATIRLGKTAEEEARKDHDWGKAVEIRAAQAEKVAEIRESRLLWHATKRRLNKFKIHSQLSNNCGLTLADGKTEREPDSISKGAGGSGGGGSGGKPASSTPPNAGAADGTAPVKR